MKTFDIKTFNEKIVNETSYEYETDNSKIIQAKYFNDYVEFIYPKGKFYDILNVYYPNGKIKEHGIRIKDLKIGKWEFYDEHGNVTIVDEDAKFHEFDYNKALLFLDGKGYVNINNGTGIDNFTLGYYSDIKRWEITAKDKSGNWLIYTLSGKSGRVIKVENLKIEE